MDDVADAMDEKQDVAVDPKPRAWMVPYGEVTNIFSFVGDSILEVVERVENAKKQYHDRQDEFAPFQVLNHGTTGGVDTVWLLPRLILAVYAEYKYPEEELEEGPVNMGSFIASLAEAHRRSEQVSEEESESLGEVVTINPPTEEEGSGSAT